jgi:hypothetical protein
MSMLPEEFPLVLTVFMVMGAWRISRARQQFEPIPMVAPELPGNAATPAKVASQRYAAFCVAHSFGKNPLEGRWDVLSLAKVMH